MSTVKNLTSLIINKLSKAQYTELLNSGSIDSDVCLIPHEATPAFSKIITDNGTIEATQEQDTLKFTSSNSVTVSGDAVNKKVTFSAVTASTSTPGVVELYETTDNTDNKAITPAGVYNRLYHETQGLEKALKDDINDAFSDLKSTTTESSETSIEFIDGVVQTDGKITSVTKKRIPDATTTVYGVTKLTNDIDSTEGGAITPLGLKSFAERLNYQTYYSIMRDMIAAWRDNDGKIVVISEGTPEITKQRFAYTNIMVMVLPTSVISISEGAFQSSGLTSIIIPDSVIEIGKSAFEFCLSLTSVEIPNSVTSIGDFAFYNCRALTSITVSEDNTSFKDIAGNLYTKDGASLIQYAVGKTDTSFTIPNSVTSINHRAFAFANNLTSITIPNSVISIGGQVFSNCDKLNSTINYDGTKTDWDKIEKSDYWNLDLSQSKIITTVVCNDDTITV